MPNDGTVKIGTELDESGLKEGLQNLKKDILKATESLKDINNALKLDPKNIELLIEKQKLLKRSVLDASKEYEKLQAELDKAKSSGLSEKDAEAYRKLVIEVSNAKTALNNFQKELKDTETSIENANKETIDFKKELSNLGDTAKTSLKGTTAVIGGIYTAAIGAVAALSSLESAAEEYRTAQGKLNTAFEAAGYSAEEAKQAYNAFYSILGDIDTATEASQLLAKLALNAEDMSTWTDIAAGVWGTFGDSLPIEGLIESANETARVGTVTGTLADALNWASINEDDFNAKLAACSTEAERNRLIMDTLSSTYNEASEVFYKNNEALIESRKKQAELDEMMGKLGATASALKSEIMSQLIPALQNLVSNVDLDQFAQTISSFILSVVENGPKIISIAAGIGAGFAAWKITTIVTNAVTSIKALVTALQTAKTAQAGLNAVMSANPFAAIASTIAAVATSLGSLIAINKLTAESQRDLNDAISETERQRNESLAEIEEEKNQTFGMISALQSLIAEEQKSQAQKEQIKSIVDQLNEAIPELNLAYDEQADSINMTAEAIRNLAEAEAIRAIQQENNEALIEQYKLRFEAIEQLEQAEKELAEAEEQMQNMASNFASGQRNLSTETHELIGKIRKLREQIDDSNDAILNADKIINDLSNANEELAESVSNTTESVQENQQSIEDLTAASEELRESTKNLTSEYNLYKNALQEQQEAGSISLDTALELIDAGYSAALAIDTETGAVKLNRAAYVELASAKIDAQIAAIEEQKASANAYVAHLNEAIGNTSLSETYFKLAEAKAAAEGEIKTYDAQIASLKNLKKSIQNYTVSVKTSSSVGQRAATQAEKDLEKYKNIRDELDYLLAIGQVSEEQYYKRLKELRDQYLTDKDNIDEYRKINEELYKYDQEIAEKEQELRDQQNEQLEKQKEEQNKILEQQIQDRKEKYQDIRDELAHLLTLDQISQEEYYKKLRDLRDEYLTDPENIDEYRRVTEEIYKYDQELAEKEKELWENQTEELKNSIEERIDEINQSKTEMANKLSDIGDLFVSKDGFIKINDLQSQIDAINKYGDTLESLKNRGISSGLLAEITQMDVSDAMAYGSKLLEMTDEDFEEYNALWEEKQKIARDVAETFYKDQIDILEQSFTSELTDALSEVPETMESLGKDAIQAWIDGFKSKLGDASNAISSFLDALDISGATVLSANANMTPAIASTTRFSAENTMMHAAGMIVASNSIPVEKEIVLNLNGTEVARAILPDIRSAEDQSPRITSDKR